MKYEVGDFIHHAEYGVGQVTQISQGNPDDVTLNFHGFPEMVFTSYLLDRSAHKLSSSGYHVLVYCEPEYAQLLLQEDPVEVVYLVLQDFPDYQAKTEDIKDYLADAITNWEEWWEKTQPLLKADPRIDSSQSRQRQYAVARQVVSQAEETYLAFRRLKDTINAPHELAQRALAALSLERKGSALPEDHKDELLAFLNNLIASNRTPSGLRLEIMFHMVEEKLLSPAETQYHLDTILNEGLRLYQLSPFVQKRVVEDLTRRPIDSSGIDLLISGICGSDATIELVVNWAIRKSSLDVIALILKIAFTENLPPELVEGQYPTLKNRLKKSLNLVQSLPAGDGRWPDIFVAFSELPSALASLQKYDQVYFLFQPLITLAANLHLRAQSLPEQENLILESLVGPHLPIAFIFELFRFSIKLEGAAGFHKKLVDYLFTNAERRQDQFLVPFVSSSWSDPYDQAQALMELIRRFPQIGMIEQGGRYFSELARRVEPDQLTRWIPFLDEFQRREGEWSWRTMLAGLRSRAYLAWLQEISDSIAKRSYHDDALEEAAKKWLEGNRASLLNQIAEEHERTQELQKQLNDLEALLSEKEKIFVELRSGFKGDTQEARFEERSRLLKELVNSLAEFERLAARQEILSQEFHAILRRLENLIQAQGVIAQEPIASQVAFNPQKHRYVGKGEINNGDMVVVEERGYLIRDSQGRLRILKPAFVKRD